MERGNGVLWAMKRPSKKEIQAAVDKLKEKTSNSSGPQEAVSGKPAPKKTSQRIRKQGI